MNNSVFIRNFKESIRPILLLLFETLTTSIIDAFLLKQITHFCIILNLFLCITFKERYLISIKFV